jgi:hypothetical protein
VRSFVRRSGESWSRTMADAATALRHRLAVADGAE